MSWFSENYRYTLIEGIPVVYAWLTAGVEYMMELSMLHILLFPVPLPDDDAEVFDLQWLVYVLSARNQIESFHLAKHLNTNSKFPYIDFKEEGLDSNIDTKFFDLVMGEYNGFDLHKKQEFKKHILRFFFEAKQYGHEVLRLVVAKYNDFAPHEKRSSRSQ
uniref:Uncharacterized protein n=1 Tax=Ditylenchus dipsaci TaxID=166011 RepID=A0A915EKA2_9BILA